MSQIEYRSASYYLIKAACEAVQRVSSGFSYAAPFPLSILGHTLYSRFTPHSLRWVGHCCDLSTIEIALSIVSDNFKIAKNFLRPQEIRKLAGAVSSSGTKGDGYTYQGKHRLES